MFPLPLPLLLLLAAVAHAQQPSSAPATGTASAPPAPTSANVSGTASANPGLSSPPTFPVNLPSTNPTAVPLTGIIPTAATQSTVPLDSTYAAGAQQTNFPNAPPLPDISTLNPANYPALDKPPPTDSPEVKQWISQVQSSGVTIPGFAPTVLGGCPTNPDAVADSSRCWWTCSQCSRPTDIISCPDKLTWGSSFDDGPSPYTPSLVQFLDEQKLKTTFFVVGSRVISRPTFLQSQYMGGHQVRPHEKGSSMWRPSENLWDLAREIPGSVLAGFSHIAVHTWSHTALTTQTNEEIIAEFGWSKKVIKDVLGVTPNVFRPPFGDIDDRVRVIAAAMGLTPIIWTSGDVSNHVSFDTNDFNIDAGTVSASGVINNFNNILKNATIIDTGFIVLEHDLFQQSVDLATGYIIPEALAMNFTLKPIVSCLNKPLSDAYVETNNNNTNPTPTASGSSIGGGAATTLSPGAATSTGSSGSGGARASVRVSWGGLAAVVLLAALR